MPVIILPNMERIHLELSIVEQKQDVPYFIGYIAKS